MVCIIGVGLYLSIGSGFLQIRKFGYAMRQTIGRIFKKGQASHGSITPFQAVCTALAATVGTGNIAGVAGAIAYGGPGAVFWMWISALLGMCTKFSEVVLAVHFRERNEKGDWVSIFTAIALCCFAFSTIVGWGLYGSRCMEFLFGSKSLKIYMVAYALISIVGATTDLGLIWSISETFNGLMTIPNLIAVFLLSGTVFKLTREHFESEGSLEK